MMRIAIALLFGITVVVFSFWGKRFLHAPPQNPARHQQSAPQRIVALAPSIVEVLFALELGDAVVGVARESDYPPEAASKPEVGGYFDPNYEAIVALNPDLIVILKEHADARLRLESLGYRTLQVQHNAIDQIVDSIRVIGRAANVQPKADQLVSDLRRQLDSIQRSVKHRDPPRVLIVVGRDVRLGSPESICVAGKGGLFDQMLMQAGGINAFEGHVPFPTVSREGILRMDPDVVIDAIGDMVEHDLDHQSIISQWSVLPQLKAVRNNRVYVFDQQSVIIPGPRFIQTISEMARVLHRDLDVE
jgi:cobalamin transport system substrate-binding protein